MSGLKRRLALALGLLLCLAAVCACQQGEPESFSLWQRYSPAAPAEAEQPRVLFLEHSETADTIVGYYTQVFAQQVAEQSDNTLQVQIYANNALSGGSVAAERMLRDNVLQMRVSSGPAFTALAPLLQPCLSGLSLEELEALLAAGGTLDDYISQLCAAQGLLLLDWLPAQYLVMSADRPLTSVSDLSGLRVRQVVTPTRQAFWQALGAEPVSYSLSETQAALELGRFEATAGNSVLNMAAFHFYWPDGYLILTDHEIFLRPIYMNQACWDSLTPAQQALIRSAAAAACELAAAERQQWYDAALASLAADGVRILDFPPAERAAMLEKAREPVYQALCQTLGQEQVDYILSLLP